MQEEAEKFTGRHSAKFTRTHSLSYTYLVMTSRGSDFTMDLESINGH